MHTSTTTYTYLDRALNEARRAAEEHAEAGHGRSGDADAIYQLTRLAEGVRDRITAEPVLDGATRMVPAQSLVPTDRIIGPDGTVSETVQAVTYQLYTVDVHTDVGTTSRLERGELVEVAYEPAR